MTFAFSRRAGRARWPLLAVCSVACGWPTWALAQAPAEPDAQPSIVQPAASDTTDPNTHDTNAAPAEPRFDVDVQASAELRAFLLRHLELIRFREL